ncbi:serine hydrolase domain-containing protein [Xanthocytophaga flava]|uniref:serine hydrolase domain-containing protein n=1 Tax=Xanthocytophaga flava TaxID=3048013 RepID=UPI0028D79B3B|nr:serine hydrolase domain-containing protein [Xanthocytophaga flavus]MDJ1470824.1 serine hydrolase domain-containing protein [Xanthocytophaga flavus]
MKTHTTPLGLRRPVVLLPTLFLWLACIGIHSYGQTQASLIDSLVKAYYREGKFEGAILVADAGKVVYKNGFGWANRERNIPATPGTIFRIASLTKQFTAVLVMQLVEARKIDLNGKITDYLPDYPKEAGSRVSVHHLLTHTSGIPEFDCPNCSLPDTLKKAYAVDDLIRQFGRGKLAFMPGSNFRYSNMDYFILGAIIEKVTGQTYEQVLYKKIIKPLGLRHTGMDAPGLILANKAQGYFRQGNHYSPDPEIHISNLHAAASMYSTVEDLLKWNQALYAKPNRLLSRQSLDTMFNKTNKPLFHLGYVGYSTWIYPLQLDATKKVIVHERRGEVGGFHSSLVRIVEAQQSIILLSNTGTPDSVGVLYELSTQIAKILQEYDRVND